MTTVSSTSSFCSRRRRRRLLGRQAAARRPRHHIRRRLRRAARTRAASAPSPPHHLQSRKHARALSAIGWSLHGHEQARLGSPSAAPPQRARVKARGERAARRSNIASGSLGAAPSSDAPGAGRSGVEARGARRGCTNFCTDARIKGGPSQYPEEAAALAFFRVPRIHV